MKFKMTGTVTRQVTDTVSLTVEAESELHAHALAEKVLSKFPDSHEEDGVSYCYIEHRVNHGPDHIETEIVEDKKLA